jgi:hypothetical protein
MLPPSQEFTGSLKGIRIIDIDLTKGFWERVTHAHHGLEWQGEGDGPLVVMSQYAKQSIWVQN